MDRVQIIQKFININDYKTYLEIGTYKGVSLLPLKCRKKVAVDPFIQIWRRKKLKWILKNPYNLNNSYFEMKSEDFFETKKEFLNKLSPEIVFVDGLHTYEASLNDTLNSLKFLKEGGVIILHDCYPPYKAAATPGVSSADAKKRSVEGWTGLWCGDVWKTIVYLRRKYSGILEVDVLNTDMGLGIVKVLDWQKLDLGLDKKLYDEVDQLTYEQMEANASELIGLKSPETLEYANS
ncbi:class I SAM-dependent methyltransferase [Christiangramia echinicola]|uniref:Methyltransferase domain-containing protein n=1 Tax=Christiangramia echinicola TaxID=279359 RepID=A0A1H1L5I6_9FLAO|nr:class I SAM-dependent methyltransferase [Christiangramia echinicola]SDR69305.1 Methyltransferase domain-containing protein [Christiangramia echinicola]